MDLWPVYHDNLPPLLAELMDVPALRRLDRVGMNCGCEYTDFPRFRDLAPYSRFRHSVGVALIVWHFTGDPAAAVAGLLHDAATPVFAHVVDFLRGDYLTQEATEDGTEELIVRSGEIRQVLDRYGIPVGDVVDYHRYPVADNDAPRLSADRLEYTMGNLVNFRLADPGRIRELYADLTVASNEEGAPELAFRSGEVALSFARGALACSEIYVSREDRYAMQMLSEFLRDALRAGVLSEGDLMTTEPEVIRKLRADALFSRRWTRFCSLREMIAREVPGPEEGWRQIAAKKRHIDPFVAGKGRVSGLYPAFGEALRAFLSQPQTEWLMGR